MVLERSAIHGNHDTSTWQGEWQCRCLVLWCSGDRANWDDIQSFPWESLTAIVRGWDVAKLLNDCLGIILIEDVGCVLATFILCAIAFVAVYLPVVSF